MAHRVKNVRRLVLGMSKVVVWPIGPRVYLQNPPDPESMISRPQTVFQGGGPRAEGHMNSFTPLRIKFKLSTLTPELSQSTPNH